MTELSMNMRNIHLSYMAKNVTLMRVFQYLFFTAYCSLNIENLVIVPKKPYTRHVLSGEEYFSVMKSLNEKKACDLEIFSANQSTSITLLFPNMHLTR